MTGIYRIFKIIRIIFIFLVMLFLTYYIAVPVAKIICIILTVLLSGFFKSIFPMAFQMFEMNGGLYNLYIYNCKFVSYFYTFLLSIISTHIINDFIFIGVKNNGKNK